MCNLLHRRLLWLVYLTGITIAVFKNACADLSNLKVVAFIYISFHIDLQKEISLRHKTKYSLRTELLYCRKHFLCTTTQRTDIKLSEMTTNISITLVIILYLWNISQSIRILSKYLNLIALSLHWQHLHTIFMLQHFPVGTLATFIKAEDTDWLHVAHNDSL